MKKNFLLYILILFLFLGCSTQKNTWLSRGYHNLTARYNVLFNGKQSFEQGRESMRESLKEDFTTVLPMFAFSEAGGGQVPSSQMRRAIRKGHKLIDKHSITAKPGRSPSGRDESYREYYNQREFNRWVDDAWMLIGKSHLYGQEWYEAINAFEMVIQTFPEKMVHFEAMLWIARAFIEAGEFENARLYLDRYSSGIGDDERFLAEATSTNAWYWLAQEEYDEALDFCIQAADNAKDRWQRIQWHFVLGQVAEEAGQLDLAQKAYSKVLTYNPEYDFGIHARVKSALLEGGPDHPEESRSKLNKYAREYKNLEYRDQIHYALAETWFWEGDTLNALTNLQLAAGYGGQNRSLTGNIYHRMADVYFKSGDYIAASVYYDSTLVTLPSDYQGIREIERLRNNLEPLAENLKVVQHEDSVQRIAAMSEEDRELFIDELLVQMEEEEEERQFTDDTDDAFFYRNFANRGNRTTDESGKWYFYNQTMVSLGKMEFEKRWGRRELDDNWRRENKESQARSEDEDEDEGLMPDDPFGENSPGPGERGDQEDETETAEGGVPDRETLISGLPLSPEEKEMSHLLKQKSLFNAAHVLMHNFDKHSEAVELFEQLLRQYPESSYRQQSLMGVFMACRKMNNRECTNHYGNVIIEDFPESPFAEFVKDPDFFEKQESFEREMNQLYTTAYDDFKRGRWSSVRQNTDQILSKNYEALLPQATLLNAAAFSQTGNQQEFKNKLQQIVDNYPQTSQASIAKHWLQLIDEGRKPEKINLEFEVRDEPEVEEGTEREAVSEPESKFALEFDTLHHIMIVLPREADINQLLFHLANFNFDRFTTGGLQIGTSNIGSSNRVLETGPFENRKIGMDYFFSLLNNPSLFKVDEVGEPTVLLLSEKNREAINDQADVEEYIDFFLENYLPGSGTSAIMINESEIPEKSYVELQKTEIFSSGQDELWGMIIVPGRSGNVSQALSFVPNVLRSLIDYQMEVSETSLPDGTSVLLAKAFKERTDYEEFLESLDNNNHWNTRIVGDDWIIRPVSPNNFKKLENGEADVEEYLEFLENETSIEP